MRAPCAPRWWADKNALPYTEPMKRKLVARIASDEQVPTAKALDTPGLREMVATFGHESQEEESQEPVSGQNTALVLYRPNWMVLDAVEAHIPCKPSRLDLLYERSQAAKKDAIQGTLLLWLLAFLMRIIA